MMKKITILLLLIGPIGHAQVRLSEDAQVSVLTCGPWQRQLYAAFGHSAFRINDPVNGIDYVYNYGVFNFNKPNFYLNFARGQNMYQLGVFEYRNFEYAYIYENRYIHEQVLNLRQEEKQKIYDYLEWNALPENQEYLYDYFYDNCATKLPEVVLEVFQDSVKFDGSYINTHYSFRELTDLYLKHQPWGDVGIDIGLGLPTDKKATPYEYMFLPEFVESGFAHASISHDGTWEPLVRSRSVIYEALPEKYPFNPLHPLIVFSVFLVITVVLSYRDLKRKKLLNTFDSILFGVLGILGIALLLLWTATSHQAAAKNFNMLWAWPTHIVVAFAVFRHRSWLRKYFLVVAILTAGLLISWPLLPQKLNYFLVPFVMAIGIRAYTQFRVRKEQEG